MNWDDLKIFLAAGRSIRMDLAARAIGIDPSTVGRRISRLEASLGVTLFEQSRTGHVLTESGRMLMEHAENVERSVSAARGELTGEPGALSGFIRISVSEAFGTWILSRHLPRFQDEHPRITLDVVASGGFLSPSKREADIAVMLARPARGPLIARRIVDYRLGLYASDGYLAAQGVPTSIEGLSGHRFVGFIPDLISVPEQRLMDDIPGALAVTVRSSSINAQAAMVFAGSGIGVLPRFIGEQLPGIRRVLPDDVRLTRTFWLVVHKDVRRLARIDAFVSWLLDVFKRDQALIVGPDD